MEIENSLRMENPDGSFENLDQQSQDPDDDDDAIEVINIQNIQSYLALDERIDDEINLFDMTALGAFLLLEPIEHTNGNKRPSGIDDLQLQRLSIAYERVHSVPGILIRDLAPNVKILDISHNLISHLEFLVHFKVIENLICDHNPITEHTRLPYLPKLELLWMNQCKINSLCPWARRLQLACPNLKYLSLMGNPMAPSYLNGGNFYEYLQYRLFIISLFPNLVHLDDKPVTQEQREEARRVYHRPLVERMITRTQLSLPSFLRRISEAVVEVLTPGPSEPRNSVV